MLNEWIPPSRCFYTSVRPQTGNAGNTSDSYAPTRWTRSASSATPEQVHLPANRLYAGRTDLVLLHVDPMRLGAPVRWERGVRADPASMRFPHLSGPLPVAAVAAVTEYRPGSDGRFHPGQSPAP